MFCQEFERSFSEEAEDDGGVVYREADDYVEEEEEGGYSLDSHFSGCRLSPKGHPILVC